MMKNVKNGFRDQLNIGSFAGEFREGFHGGHLIQLLEIPTADISLITGARDHDQWPGVSASIRESSKAVDTARARDGEEYARAAGEVPIGGGGVAGRLLIVEGDESDT